MRKKDNGKAELMGLMKTPTRRKKIEGEADVLQQVVSSLLLKKFWVFGLECSYSSSQCFCKRFGKGSKVLLGIKQKPTRMEL